MTKRAARAAQPLARSIRLACAVGCVCVCGCGVGQTPDCARYVECQAAVDPAVDTAPWDEGGSCWTLPDTARHCDAQCRAALDALRDLPDPPAACAP